MEVARAEALGEAIKGMKMNLYGDTNTAHRVLQLVTAAQATQGVYDALPTGARRVVDQFADALGGGKSDQGRGSIQALLRLVAQDYADAVKQNVGLGELAETLLERESGLDAAQRETLQRIVDNPVLGALPLRTVLDLADDFLS